MQPSHDEENDKSPLATSNPVATDTSPPTPDTNSSEFRPPDQGGDGSPDTEAATPEVHPEEMVQASSRTGESTPPTRASSANSQVDETSSENRIDRPDGVHSAGDNPAEGRNSTQLGIESSVTATCESSPSSSTPAAQSLQASVASTIAPLPSPAQTVAASSTAVAPEVSQGDPPVPQSNSFHSCFSAAPRESTVSSMPVTSVIENASAVTVETSEGQSVVQASASTSTRVQESSTTVPVEPFQGNSVVQASPSTSTAVTESSPSVPVESPSGHSVSQASASNSTLVTESVPASASTSTPVRQPDSLSQSTAQNSAPQDSTAPAAVSAANIKKSTRLPEQEKRDGDASEDGDHQEDDEDDEEEDKAPGGQEPPDKAVEKSPLGRFVRFSQKLGSGSYKVVYLGFDTDTGKEIAWNIINFRDMRPKERKRITEEINLLKSIKHPRIVSFISAWINKKEEQVCFITERVSGGSLLHYIRRIDQQLKTKIIRNWSRQIAEGLAYLHEREIIHRDLKCDNIFIHGNVGEVLIGDLGLSTTLNHTFAASIVGTPEFMAPELYDEKYGTPVDIYAFGMCLVEMVSQGSPFKECTTAAQVYKKVIGGQKPQVVRRIQDTQLRALVEQCIHLDPNQRPRAEALVSHPWLQANEADGNSYCELIPEEELKPEEDSVLQSIPEDRQPEELRVQSVSGVVVQSGTTSSAVTATGPEGTQSGQTQSAPVTQESSSSTAVAAVEGSQTTQASPAATHLPTPATTGQTQAAPSGIPPVQQPAVSPQQQQQQSLQPQYQQQQPIADPQSQQQNSESSQTQVHAQVSPPQPVQQSEQPGQPVAPVPQPAVVPQYPVQQQVPLQPAVDPQAQPPAQLPPTVQQPEQPGQPVGQLLHPVHAVQQQPLQPAVDPQPLSQPQHSAHLPPNSQQPEQPGQPVGQLLQPGVVPQYPVQQQPLQPAVDPQPISQPQYSAQLPPTAQLPEQLGQPVGQILQPPGVVPQYPVQQQPLQPGVDPQTMVQQQHPTQIPPLAQHTLPQQQPAPQVPTQTAVAPQVQPHAQVPQQSPPQSHATAVSTNIDSGQMPQVATQHQPQLQHPSAAVPQQSVLTGGVPITTLAPGGPPVGMQEGAQPLNQNIIPNSTQVSPVPPPLQQAPGSAYPAQSQPVPPQVPQQPAAVLQEGGGVPMQHPLRTALTGSPRLTMTPAPPGVEILDPLAEVPMATWQERMAALEKAGFIEVSQVQISIKQADRPGTSTKVNVTFDFNIRNDTALTVAHELKDAIDYKIADRFEDLVVEIERAVMRRAGELLPEKNDTALPLESPTRAHEASSTGTESLGINSFSGINDDGQTTRAPVAQQRLSAELLGKRMQLSAAVCSESSFTSDPNKVKEVSLLQRSLEYLFASEVYVVVGGDLKAGEWCEGITEAIKSFQERHSLPGQKGIADDKFWEKILEEVKKKENKEAKREEDKTKAAEDRKAKKAEQDRESALQLEQALANCAQQMGVSNSTAAKKTNAPANEAFASPPPGGSAVESQQPIAGTGPQSVQPTAATLQTQAPQAHQAAATLQTQAPQAATLQTPTTQAHQAASLQTQAPQAATLQTPAPQTHQAAALQTQAPQAATLQTQAPQAHQAATLQTQAPQAATLQAQAPQAHQAAPLQSQAPQAATLQPQATQAMYPAHTVSSTPTLSQQELAPPSLRMDSGLNVSNLQTGTQVESNASAAPQNSPRPTSEPPRTIGSEAAPPTRPSVELDVLSRACTDQAPAEQPLLNLDLLSGPPVVQANSAPAIPSSTAPSLPTSSPSLPPT